MRLFMQFSPSFLSLPVAAIDVLKEKDVEFVGGLYYGTRRFYDWLIDQPQCKGKPIFYPDLEEVEWAQQPLNRSELERIRNTYGDDALHKIIIGDRHIGFGYVNGASVTPTSLTKAIGQGGSEAIWQYVVALIRETEKVLDETRPDAMFQYAVAGAIAFAAKLVAKSRGIRLLAFEHARIESRVFITDTDDPARQILERCRKPETICQESVAQAQRQMKELRTKGNQPEYNTYGMSVVRKRNSIRSLGKSLAKMAYGSILTKHDTPHSSRFHNGACEAMTPFRVRHQKKELNKLCSPFNKDRLQPYAYFPLHVDPEASTMVYAPHYTDQIHVIRSIAQSLPFGMKLLVKEHEPMVGLRPRGFYSQIAQMPGVVLIPPGVNSHVVIHDASLIVTITGTGGLEAAIMGKPVVILGNPYFRHLQEGVVHLPDHPSLEIAISTALKDGPASDDVIVQFLAAVNEACFDFPSHYLWSTVAQGSSEKLLEAAELFAEELARCFSN